MVDGGGGVLFPSIVLQNVVFLAVVVVVEVVSYAVVGCDNMLWRLRWFHN